MQIKEMSMTLFTKINNILKKIEIRSKLKNKNMI
jgi:hypothetical protein